MSVYFIGQVEVRDPAEYRLYMKGFLKLFGNYRGEVLAADDHTAVIEGEWASKRTVIIRFDDEREARRWYESEEYQTAAQHRHAAARTNLVLVQGLS